MRAVKLNLSFTCKIINFCVIILLINVKSAWYLSLCFKYIIAQTLSQKYKLLIFEDVNTQKKIYIKDKCSKLMLTRHHSQLMWFLLHITHDAIIIQWTEMWHLSFVSSFFSFNRSYLEGYHDGCFLTSHQVILQWSFHVTSMWSRVILTFRGSKISMVLFCDKFSSDREVRSFGDFYQKKCNDDITVKSRSSESHHVTLLLCIFFFFYSTQHNAQDDFKIESSNGIMRATRWLHCNVNRRFIRKQ